MTKKQWLKQKVMCDEWGRPPSLADVPLTIMTRKDALIKQVLVFLLKSDRDDGLPNDPVARFHLGNGAILERINLNSDLSLKGLNQSKGIMINYLYDLDTLEENHELFFKTKEVKLSDGVKTLKRKLQVH